MARESKELCCKRKNYFRCRRLHGVCSRFDSVFDARAADATISRHFVFRPLLFLLFLRFSCLFENREKFLAHKQHTRNGRSTCGQRSLMRNSAQRRNEHHVRQKMHRMHFSAIEFSSYLLPFASQFYFDSISFRCTFIL